MPIGNLVSATSKDGLTWVKNTAIVAPNANTPGALFDGQNMRVYFCRKGGVFVSVSNDGIHWEEKSVRIAGLPEGKIALDPEVVLLSDGRYRMYYYEHPQAEGIPLALQGDFVTASAISDDGVNFQREDGQRFAYERSMDPDVIQIGNDWYLFLSKDGRTVVAVSRDGGMTFDFEEYLRVGDAVSDGFISTTIEADGGYRMYFNKMSGRTREKPAKIYSAFSRDGVRWTADPGVRIEGGPPGSLDEHGAGSMAVLKTSDGTYWMFYVSERI